MYCTWIDLGQVTTDLTELSQRADFFDWTPSDPEVITTFKLMNKPDKGDKEESKEAEGTLTIRLSNVDTAVHFHPRLVEPSVQADLARRKAQHNRRHLYLTDEAAEIADLKEASTGLQEQVSVLQGQVGEILSILKEGKESK